MSNGCVAPDASSGVARSAMKAADRWSAIGHCRNRSRAPSLPLRSAGRTRRPPLHNRDEKPLC